MKYPCFCCCYYILVLLWRCCCSNAALAFRSSIFQSSLTFRKTKIPSTIITTTKNAKGLIEPFHPRLYNDDNNEYDTNYEYSSYMDNSHVLSVSQRSFPKNGKTRSNRNVNIGFNIVQQQRKQQKLNLIDEDLWHDVDNNIPASNGREMHSESFTKYDHRKHENNGSIIYSDSNDIKNNGSALGNLIGRSVADDTHDDSHRNRNYRPAMNHHYQNSISIDIVDKQRTEIRIKESSSHDDDDDNPSKMNGRTHIAGIKAVTKTTAAETTLTETKIRAIPGRDNEFYNDGIVDEDDDNLQEFDKYETEFFTERFTEDDTVMRRINSLDKNVSSHDDVNFTNSSDNNNTTGPPMLVFGTTLRPNAALYDDDGDDSFDSITEFDWIFNDGDSLNEFDMFETAFFEEAFISPSTEDQVYTCAIDWDNINQPYISRMDSMSTFIEYTDDGSVCVPAGPVGRWKENVACFLAEPIVEVAVCTLVIMNCFLVALSTLPSFSAMEAEFLYLENIIGVLFFIEFMGGWWSTSATPFRHVLSAQFTIDVVVVVIPLLFGVIPTLYLRELLPPWLISPSALTNLKLLRVLRLRRVLQDKMTFSKFEVALGLQKTTDASRIQDWQLQLARVLLSLFTLLSVASGLIYTAEHEVNPAFTDYFTALYFGLTTLTTVGFGDITPITWQGRLVVSGSILAGVAIIPAQAAALVEAFITRQQDQSIRNNNRGGGGMDLGFSAIEASTTASLRKRTNVTTKVAKNTKTNDSGALEANLSCPNCNATMHFTAAKFCWSCGHQFDTQ